MTQERREQPRSPNGETLNAPLPELKISQVLKSPEPVIKSNERGLIQPVGEYTAVLGREAKEITVLDKVGRKVEGLNNTQTMILDWPTLTSKGGYGSYAYIAIDPNKLNYDKRAYSIGVNKFPAHLQPVVTEYIKQKGQADSVDTPNQAWNLPTSDVKSLKVKSGDGYILFYQEKASGSWIGFQTQDERGLDLPPRNWKRFDLADEWAGRWPQTIAAEIRNLRIPDLTSIDRTEKGDYVLALKDSLVVSKPGKKISEADFKDQLVGIGNNICKDPKNKNVVYYCTTDNPRLLIKLDTTNDPSTWVTETVDIPQAYINIRNLQLDPTGNFFMFNSGIDFVILAKDTLQEVQKIPKLSDGKLDDQGRIRGFDERGHLVIYDANFQEVSQELEKRRVARLAQGITVDLFKKESATATKIETDQLQHLVPVKTNLETQFNTQLQQITALDDMSIVGEALTKLRTRLKSEGLQPAQIDFITQGIQDSIAGKERILAAPIVAQGLTELHTKLGGNLTVTSITEARGDLAKLKSLEGLVDDATRIQIRALENQFGQQSAELFRREGSVIEKDVGELVTGVKAELEKMATIGDFADWQEFRLPQLVSRLGALANDCPIEASETQRKILTARRQLQEISRENEKKFKEHYSEVREKASEVMGERVELMKVDIDSFTDRLRGRGFKDRAQAESYARSSEALEALRTEIEELKRQNPDAAKELDKVLKVQLATVMAEIERGGLTTVAETGQQMILFGDTLFPKWEGKVQEKVQRQVDLIFIPDERTKGPGVTADKVLGDIGIIEINSRGKLEKQRLYEGMQDEDEWRYGSVSYRGEYVFPSYLTQAEYRKLKQEYADWNKGDGSKLKQELNEKRGALKDWYKQRQKPGERDPHNDDQWGGKYRELLQDYATFSAEHHILLLTRIDQMRNAPETEFANGSGYVPEWQSHWTVDEDTEGYLEGMAQASKMQLDLQEGLLNLKGHAGTGKDVLVKMFCNRSNRPYFAIDCSKWTTEFELSEDVVLEAEDGASKTVKVPSIVLNAITTPGAVMYFNEINAMPEQAQIFLHGLTDEKRTLTLKTSSGKSIRSDKTVILMGSMNPGYPGTFNPQFATKSRMVGLEIDYPKLYRERDPNDPNPNPPLSAAEALRVARQVDSLADLTYEANPQHNDFVKIWDRHVNGIQNGAPDLTQTQRFDVEAILTMVEFAQKLREGFILKFEKARASAIPRGTLLVDQPITGREMRRMAYFLSKMSAEEKATANPEAVVRNLIERFFLSHIDKKDEKDDIRTAMATWTSSKRPAA